MDARTSTPVFQLSNLSDFLSEQMGLNFPQDRWGDLDRGIAAAASEFGMANVESCIRWLQSAPLTRQQIEILAGHLTVGETYFLRERNSFKCLEEQILPELIRARRDAERRLRIWSAGCSTGEEPYSIAILLARMIPDLKNWNITILATDINPRSLRKALQGVYKEWSFRDTPPGYKEQCFKKTGDGHFEVPAHIKDMVTFSYLNLADDAYPSLENNTNAMDIIFCRNVLMYFEPRRAKRAAQNLHRALLEGGWLIVSPTEASHVLFSRFMPVNFPGATLYKKDGNPVQTGQTPETLPIRYVEEPVAPRWPVPGPAAEPVALPNANGEFPPMDAGQQKTPVPPQTPYKEAVALYEQGRYADAAGILGTSLSLDQSDARAMALLARAYANQGSLGEALAWCEKAVAADKLNPAWCYLLAAILQEQGEIKNAVAILQRALYLDQNFALGHFALGNLTRRQGKHHDSKRHFRNALLALNGYRDEHVLPESEGITAGRLVQIIRATVSSEART